MSLPSQAAVADLRERACHSVTSLSIGCGQSPAPGSLRLGPEYQAGRTSPDLPGAVRTERTQLNSSHTDRERQLSPEQREMAEDAACTCQTYHFA